MATSGPTRKDVQMLTPEKPAQKVTRSNRLVPLVDQLRAQVKGGDILPEPKAASKILPPEEKLNDTVDRDFLKDLLWIYKQWGGKLQLLEEVKKDPDIRKLVLSTLLKSGLLSGGQGAAGKKPTAKDKQEGPKKGFLLVMKGLHETTKDEKAKSPLESINPTAQETSYSDDPLHDGDLREEITVEGLDDEGTKDLAEHDAGGD